MLLIILFFNLLSQDYTETVPVLFVEDHLQWCYNYVCTKISGRYAPLILAPAESSSLEPWIIYLFNHLINQLYNYLIN
jgi:hypothetical protein